MANVKSRTRVVYFRISEEEFTKLCGLCEAQGARNLSELARSAIHALMQPHVNTVKEDISQRLSELERCLSEMNHHLKTLMENQSSQNVYRGNI
jgi:hypothetical protein